MLSHRNASDLVPQAISRIASLPWASTQKEMFSSVNTDVQSGRQRRELGPRVAAAVSSLPTGYRRAARALAGILDVELDRHLAEREANPKMEQKAKPSIKSEILSAFLPVCRVLKLSRQSLAPFAAASWDCMPSSVQYGDLRGRDGSFRTLTPLASWRSCISGRQAGSGLTSQQSTPSLS
jgi:hypothetical protein